MIVPGQLLAIDVSARNTSWNRWTRLYVAVVGDSITYIDCSTSKWNGALEVSVKTSKGDWVKNAEHAYSTCITRIRGLKPAD